MKKNLLFLFFLVVCCILRAQDTVFPNEYHDLFYFDTSYRHVGDEVAHWYFQMPGEEWAHGTNYGNAVVAVKYVTNQVTITGVAMPFGFEMRENTPDDWNHLYGIVITINNNDYQHPVIHLTNSYAMQGDVYNSHIALRYNSECGVMDTVMGAYQLYFNEPLHLSGEFYVGYYLRRAHYVTCGTWGAFGTYPCSSFEGYASVQDSSILLYNLRDDDVTVKDFIMSDSPSGQFLLCCPILTAPYTDSFACPEVSTFGYVGLMADIPTFAWDTAGEHTIYQFAYGPYDAPLDSLHVVETDNNYYELTDPSLSRDVYYQARLRAMCHHRCPVHDTVMWTSWSEPVYFYTGSQMPDTTHHQPEGIGGVDGGTAFTLAPNPAHGSVVLTLSTQPLPGTVLTVHDVTGREMMRRMLDAHEIKLSTGGMAAGVYTVTVSGPQGKSTRHLSIE